MRNELIPTQKPEIHIDVGGGTGEYLFNKAKENPDKTFVILDPFPNLSNNKNSTSKLKNLHTIIWKSDIDSHLPFLEGTISEASANFLMGELNTKEEASTTIEEDKQKYARLMRDIKNVLKKDGKIIIVDTKACINYIMEVLNEVGLKITSEPRPITLDEKEMSVWSAAFFDMNESTGKKTSSLLPMILEAIKE